MHNYLILLAVLVIAGCKTVPVKHQDLISGKVFATARIECRSNSNAEGQAWFAKNKDGIQVLVVAKNLTPGLHGIHIHEIGDCSADDASSAGPHYNPGHHKHGSSDPAMFHKGDLGNIVVSNQGYGILNLGIPGDWKDIIGKSLVLHASVDDLKSQPAGDSGGRIGCGVIKAIY